MNIDDIPDDIIRAAKRNGKLKEFLTLFLHSATDPDAMQASYCEMLERAVVALEREVEDLIEVVQLHGVINKRSDVVMLKSALVNENVRVNFGAALRFYRLKKKLRLEDLAGLRGNPASTGVLSEIETGKANFQIDTLIDVCDKLGLDLSIAAVPKITNEQAETQEVQVLSQ